MPKEVNIGEVKAERISTSTEVGFPVEQEKVEEKAEESPFYMDDKILKALRAIQEKEERRRQERFREWAPQKYPNYDNVKFQSQFNIPGLEWQRLPDDVRVRMVTEYIHTSLDDMMAHMSRQGKMPDFETLEFSFKFQHATDLFKGRWVVSDKL